MPHINHTATPPLPLVENLPGWVTSPPPLLVAAVIVILLAFATIVALTVRWFRRIQCPPEEILTIVAACIATGVSAQGMWRFSGDVLGFDGPLRLLLFAFIEVAVITSAVRARRNMRENYSAGIDGVAVWALTSLSAVLSSLDARSPAEALFRLAAPLVAAWLWERGMAIERHRITGTKRINWRITPERILVRLGLAEAGERTPGEVDTQRRITRVAVAALRARQLRDADAPSRKLARAMGRFLRRYLSAARHIGLARDPRLQDALACELAALGAASQLLDVPPAARWTPNRDTDTATGTSADTATPVAVADLDRDHSHLHRGSRSDTDTATPAVVLVAGNRSRAPRWSDPLTGATDTPNRTNEQAEVTVRERDRSRRRRETQADTATDIATQVAGTVAESTRDPDDPCDGTSDALTPLAAGVAPSVSTGRRALLPDDPGQGAARDHSSPPTKVAAMRRYWDEQVAAGVIPTGAALARAAGAHPSLGRRMRTKWRDQLPCQGALA